MYTEGGEWTEFYEHGEQTQQEVEIRTHWAWHWAQGYQQTLHSCGAATQACGPRVHLMQMDNRGGWTCPTLQQHKDKVGTEQRQTVPSGQNTAWGPLGSGRNAATSGAQRRSTAACHVRRHGLGHSTARAEPRLPPRHATLGLPLST